MSATIIVPKTDAIIEDWAVQQARLERARLTPPESQIASPEKFIRAVEQGGNFGLQADFDAGIQRLRMVAANATWNAREGVVICVTPIRGTQPAGRVRIFGLSFNDVRMVEEACASQVADHKRRRV